MLGPAAVDYVAARMEKLMVNYMHADFFLPPELIDGDHFGETSMWTEGICSSERDFVSLGSSFWCFGCGGLFQCSLHEIGIKRLYMNMANCYSTKNGIALGNLALFGTF